MTSLIKLIAEINCGDCGQVSQFNIGVYDIEVSTYPCETCGMHNSTTIWVADNCKTCGCYIDSVTVSDL